MSYLNNLQVQLADCSVVDAFGRLRVSEPLTVFDSKQIFDNGPLFWDDQQVSGGSTSSNFSANTASSTLAVAAATAGVRTRQTFQRFNYQPGKSLLIFMTGVIKASGGGTGIKQYIGYFDDNNGLFFLNNAGTMEVGRRSNTSGSPVDTLVAQSSWNLDKMDGTGVSGLNLDFTKTQIFAIDFEWLGVGRVRMGVVVGGVLYYCHQFLAANTLTAVYMSTPTCRSAIRSATMGPAACHPLSRSVPRSSRRAAGRTPGVSGTLARPARTLRHQ